MESNMENIPESEATYRDFIAGLYHDFPSMLTWRHSVTHEKLYAGFCADPAWLLDIRKLLSDLQFMDSINSIELPLFRDFKSKRGALSIHYDGGDALADELIDALEDSVNAKI
jgi:hypothetical protein